MIAGRTKCLHCIGEDGYGRVIQSETASGNSASSVREPTIRPFDVKQGRCGRRAVAMSMAFECHCLANQFGDAGRR